MSLSIHQSHRYMGSDHWQWQAWLEGPAEELAAVRQVDWLLHPSFTPSVVSSSDAGNGFRLESGGWGTFMLQARLNLHDGSQQLLKSMLELYYPEADDSEAAAEKPAAQARTRRAVLRSKAQETGRDAAGGKAKSAASGAPRRVFLSYGAEDRRPAGSLRRTLEALGVQVLDNTQLMAGEDWATSLRGAQAGADATVAFVSADIPSPFVAQEVQASIQAGKPTLVVTPRPLDTVMGLDHVQRLVIPDMEQLAPSLMQALRGMDPA
jgi:hypothetical protein